MATRQRRFTKRNALEMIAAAIANVTARQATLAKFTPYLTRGG